jgi:hypothetical protein
VTEIRTGYSPNRNPKHYHYILFIGVCSRATFRRQPNKRVPNSIIRHIGAGKYGKKCWKLMKFNSHALLLRSQILSVRSWLPETTLDGSPRNLAAITFPEWPVRVCCTNKNENTLIALSARCFVSTEPCSY